jgi:hypothetical protein
MGCLGSLIRLAIGIGVILWGRELLNSVPNPLVGVAVIIIGVAIISVDLAKALLK